MFNDSIKGNNMMLSKIDYLLSCISEECGEIIQVIGKSQRFGLNDINPSKQLSNKILLKLEIHDLITAYKMLLEELNENFEIEDVLIQDKIKRIKKYMKYSEEVKRLEVC